MIALRRINGNTLYVSVRMIKFVEETPDTVITLDGGEKIMVADSAEDVARRVTDYERKMQAPRQTR